MTGSFLYKLQLFRIQLTGLQVPISSKYLFHPSTFVAYEFGYYISSNLDIGEFKNTSLPTNRTPLNVR